MKREGSRCNQAPGSTLVRKEIHGVTRAFALARIVPGKLPGSSVHLVCWRAPHRPGAPVFGIAAPQSREISAGAGCWVHKRSCLSGGSESARCPALRSEGLFGSETGSPRAHAALCAAWVSSRGGGRRAEPGLRTSRQEKPAAVPQKRKKAPSGGPPPAQNYSNTLKNGKEHRHAVGGRRAEPGLRTSRLKKPAAAAAKKRKNNALLGGAPPAQNYSNAQKTAKGIALRGVVGGPNPACGPHDTCAPKG